MLNFMLDDSLNHSLDDMRYLTLQVRTKVATRVADKVADKFVNKVLNHVGKTHA